MRIEDYHTHYLGETSNGNLFWAYETFIFLKPISEINKNNENWQNYRQDYAVLHTFDKKGNYLNSRYFSCLNNEKLVIDKVEELVAELGLVKYCDIKVKLFQTIIDDIVFGLVPYTDEDNERIDLEPSSTISFREPWNGEYDT